MYSNSEQNKGFVPTITTDTEGARIKCQGDKLPCALFPTCIPQALFCDGEPECVDNFEEGIHCKSSYLT